MASSSRILIGLGLFLGIALVVAGLSAAPAMEKKQLQGATKPVGPYSPGVDIGSLVFVAGQLGTDPATGKLAEGGIEAETRQVMKNADLAFDNVVRTRVFLTDIADFQAMNQVYASFFPEGSIPPARSTVAVAFLAAR